MKALLEAAMRAWVDVLAAQGRVRAEDVLRPVGRDLFQAALNELIREGRVTRDGTLVQLSGIEPSTDPDPRVRALTNARDANNRYIMQLREECWRLNGTPYRSTRT